MLPTRKTQKTSRIFLFSRQCANFRGFCLLPLLVALATLSSNAHAQTLDLEEQIQNQMLPALVLEEQNKTPALPALVLEEQNQPQPTTAQMQPQMDSNAPSPGNIPPQNTDPGTTWVELCLAAAQKLGFSATQMQPPSNRAIQIALQIPHSGSAPLLDVLQKIHAHDKTLDTLFRQIHRLQSRLQSSQPWNGDSHFDIIDQADLPYDTKQTLLQTLLPFLACNFYHSQNAPLVRKTHAIQQTLQRLWPNRRTQIACAQANQYLTLDIQTQPTPNDPCTLSVSPHAFDCNEAEHCDAFLNESNHLQCFAISSSDPQTPIHALQQRIQDALRSLKLRDSELTANAMALLNNQLEAFATQMPFNAPWNNHWQQIDAAQQLCQLHTLSIGLLEQHRFLELIRLERALQSAYPNATFYNRLKQNCKNALKTQDFQFEFERLQNTYHNELQWVQNAFDPKKQKKFNKAFAAWVKKPKRAKTDPYLFRRLLAAWTWWSDGNYKNAIDCAGNFTENKARRIHVQLHAFALLLKIIQKDPISPEMLSEYLHSVMLKAPWLAYETFTEAAPYLSDQDKQTVASAFQMYPTTDAFPHAARFYQAYQEAFQVLLTPQKNNDFQAWIERTQRPYESIPQANARRLHWLQTAAQHEDWETIHAIASLAQNDAPACWRAFWQQTDYWAHSTHQSPKIDAQPPLDPTDPISCQPAQDADPNDWRAQLPKCIQEKQRRPCIP